ncbi:MAG: ABC transporter substrate-binding protein [Vicinamibacterales bacterium]
MPEPSAAVAVCVPARRRAARAALAALALAIAGGCASPPSAVLTFSGSSVGREGEVIRRQLARFAAAHPELPVELRPTPDSADQRHQLFVQWLNARADDPDVLQLDVVWTPEFAAAGWIAPLDRFSPPADAFFAATVAAGRWRGQLYALPWFVDVGMLYRRTDLVAEAPPDLDTLAREAEVQRARGVPFGVVWQGARYEGLVTVFLEHLGAFGGAILDAEGRVVVDSPAAERALAFMCDAVGQRGLVPAAALAWQEEQTRFAFASGEAVFMRNWPYAYTLLDDPGTSRVAGRFAVSAWPAAPGGAATAALGGAVLAVNARSEQPDAAYALAEYLTAPAQMLERARIAGQFPSRAALYASTELAEALPIPVDQARAVIERAVPRPVTPVYSQLSEILQIALHRALTGQQAPGPALHDAATAMRALLARTGLGPAT